MIGARAGFLLLAAALWACPTTDGPLACDPNNTPSGCFEDTGTVCDPDTLECLRSCEVLPSCAPDCCGPDAGCLSSQCCDDSSGVGVCRLDAERFR